MGMFSLLKYKWPYESVHLDNTMGMESISTSTHGYQQIIIVHCNFFTSSQIGIPAWSTVGFLVYCIDFVAFGFLELSIILFLPKRNKVRIWTPDIYQTKNIIFVCCLSTNFNSFHFATELIFLYHYSLRNGKNVMNVKIYSVNKHN